MLAQAKRQASDILGPVLGRTSPARVIAAVEWLLLALLALATARLVWTVVTPVGPLGDWRPAAAGAPAVDPALFGSFDPFFRQVTDGAAQVSTLSLTLVGTRVDVVSGRGAAIIATPDGQQSSFLVGEDVVPGARLATVAFDQVTLATAGGTETLFLDQSSGAPPVTPASAGITPAPAAAAAATPPPRLAADISVVPRLKGTAITGFVLTPKGSGAAFAAAGLQPGDVLVSVNGAPVTSLDPATITRNLDAAATGGSVAIGVERGGNTVTLRIGARP